MAYEQDRSSGIGNIAHLSQAFPLEVGIAHSEHLVHNQDFRLQVGSHGESQAQVHTGGVALDGCIDELFNFRKSDDFIETGFNFLFVHTEDRPVEEDILASG